MRPPTHDTAPMPMAEPMPAEATPRPETEPGGEAGYSICLDCLPDGTYRVRKEPLHDESEEETVGTGGPGLTAGGPGAETEAEAETEAIDVDSFEQALKAAVMIHRQNPMDQAEQAQMEAGYQSRLGK